jgi:hypothetical protein
MKEEVAPPREKWPEHLKDLPDEEIIALAGDYCWLTEQNRPEEERGEFTKRRQAILAECERRGLQDAARNCRPSNGS